jgi:hypothetical protein
VRAIFPRSAITAIGGDVVIVSPSGVNVRLTRVLLAGMA